MTTISARAFQVFCLLLSANALLAAPPALVEKSPDAVGMNSARLARIDAEVEREIAAKKFPGCVVLIGRKGAVVHLKGYGNRRLEPQPEAMTVDTVFDLASVTKPMATATSVMLLVERGHLQVRDRVAQHIPEFGQNGKDKITVLQLLTHQSGLIADNAISDYRDTPEKSYERLFALKPQFEPGTRFVYSDVGFLVLGALVQRLSGQSVHEFSQANIFRPLGMDETGYLPAEALRPRAAPTEKRDGQWIQGEVHDPRAFALGGVAGHAGLFSTATDVAIYARMMLGRGELGGVRVLSPRTVDLMTQPVPVPGGWRGLGWDMQTGFSSNKGELMSSAAYGHGGFTGTGLWIDPELDLFVVFLSNRVHPDGKGLVNPLIGRIGSIAAGAIDEPPAVPARLPPRDIVSTETPVAAAPTAKGTREPAPEASDRFSPVLTGIDVLERDGFKPLAGCKVGLITNHTGVNRKGTSTIDLLARAEGVTLVALFTPEHGLEGKLDVAKIADGRDAKRNIPIFSLYGESRTPSEESLQGIDTLVFDIQDIGTRFYTYPSTMGNAMKAAANHKIRFVVLDRPNPINGINVEGPLLDAGRESFVGYHRLPVRHGMTIGELARMFNDEQRIGADLVVVPMEGWHRGDYYDATGLLWINPSPNMRSLSAALHYPGIGLLETTNLSVGRGTDTPFELIGAPWLDGQQLAEELNRAALPGVRFIPTTFTPSASKFKEERCGGVQIVVTRRDVLQPVRTGFEIATRLRKLHRNEWKAEGYDRLLGNASVLKLLIENRPAGDLVQQAETGMSEFAPRRSRWLLYQP